MVKSYKQFENFVSEVVHDIGLDIIQIKFSNQKVVVIDIIVERQDRQKMSINDCYGLNLALQPHREQLLDMLGEYHVNVSSAGLERPLVSLEDYDRFRSSIIKIKLIEKINNTSIVEGELMNRTGNILCIKNDNTEIAVDYSNIKSAKLVLTEQIFRTLLTKEG